MVERDLFLWILVGLVLGAAAKWLFPAREPGGFVLALLLGLAGALAGGFLLNSMAEEAGLLPSLAAAAAGAAAILLFYGIVIARRSR